MERPICADRNCKNKSHGHSWMRTAKSEALRKKKEKEAIAKRTREKFGLEMRKGFNFPTNKE